jgi:hypothetical protein
VNVILPAQSRSHKDLARGSGSSHDDPGMGAGSFWSDLIDDVRIQDLAVKP